MTAPARRLQDLLGLSDDELLAVLDADPLAVPADRIGAIRVTDTFVGGRQVFRG